MSEVKWGARCYKYARTHKDNAHVTQFKARASKGHKQALTRSSGAQREKSDIALGLVETEPATRFGNLTTPKSSVL